MELLINYPDLTTEKEKLEDLIKQFEIKYQEKDRKYFPEKGFVSEIEMLLKKPLFQYKNGITKFIFHTLLYNIKK